MIKREFYYPSSDGKTKIHAVEWLPDDTKHLKGIIQVAHGLSEHITMYEPVAKFFTDRFFVVRGEDHIGHGDSVSPGEPRLYFGGKGSWHFAADDIYTLRTLTRKEYGETPYIMLGFSLGSYLIRDYLIRYGETIDAAVLAGCLYNNPFEQFFGTILSDTLAKIIGEKSESKILDFITNTTPNFKFKNRKNNLAWLNENQDEIMNLMADPYAFGVMTVSLFRELLSAVKFTTDKTNIAKMNKDVPVLFVSGEDDPVANNGKTIELISSYFKEAGVKNVDTRLYRGRHRILFEKNQDDTLLDIYDWACSKLNTEGIDISEKTTPMLMSANKSLLILAKTGVPDAKKLAGDLFSDDVKITDEERIYKARYDKVTEEIDALIKSDNIKLVIDFGAGFSIRYDSLKEKVKYIAADLPAVIKESKAMHTINDKETNAEFRIADITNYDAIKEILDDNKKLLEKGKYIILTENVVEDLLDFEEEIAEINISDILVDYDGYHIASEKQGINIIKSDKNAEKIRHNTSKKFFLRTVKNDKSIMVSIEGKIDSITAPKIIDYCNGLEVDLIDRKLVFDMEQVEYITAPGINTIKLLKEKYKDKFALVNVNEMYKDRL